MKNKIILSLFVLFLFSTLPIGCSSNSSSSSANPATIVAAIKTGMTTAGAGLVTSTRLQNQRPTSASCNAQGYPVSSITTSDGRYPGYLTYCFMSVDAGDTIVGGFGLPVKVACLLNNFSVPFDGAAHTYTVTSAMISSCNMTDSGLTDGTQLSITGSTPASFNTNYTYGVVVDLTSTMGLTFKMGYRSSGTTSSFITNESWTTGNIGVTAGTLDTSTGDLRYESRVERETSTDTSSSAGWNRHNRVHAVLTMSGTTPTGLSSITFGYSNIQTRAPLTGLVITASGNLSTGIKARLWNATNGSGGAVSAASQFDTAANYTETTNTRCYTSTSETATTCGSGLDKFTTNTKFTLHSTDSHTSVTSWLAAITGQTFGDVDLDSDTQF